MNDTARDAATTTEFTPDFTHVLGIVKWNCLGFLFVEFLIPFVISAEIQASMLSLGLVVSFGMAGHVAGSPIAGYLADRVSKRKLVLAGAFGRAIAYVMMYLAIALQSALGPGGSLAGLMASELVLGFMVSFFWVPINAIIADKSAKRCRSLAFGKRQYYKGIGIVIGTAIGISIFAASNLLIPDSFPLKPFFPHASLLVYGLANALAGISFYRRVDDGLVHESKHVDERAEAIVVADASRHGRLVLKRVSLSLVAGFSFLMAAVFATMLNEAMTKPFLRVYVLENIEPNPNLAVIGFVPGTLVALFLAPKLGELADRISPLKGIATICTLGGLVTLLLVNVPNLWLFVPVHAADATLALSTGLIIDNVLSRVSKMHRGKLFGMKSLSANLGELSAPVIGGFLYDAVNARAPFFLSVLVEWSLIGLYAAVMFFIKRQLAESYDRP
ncbi:MAG: MFS transporter [Candidatus Lokiarchaeota archaeon]|nr:MFS transporter [Candidatus Lokiarchaeota archaeon]